MFNSQTSAANIAQTWRIFFAVLSFAILWQYLLTSQASAFQSSRTSVQEVQPVLSRQQIIDQDYRKAKFLTLVETNDKVQYSSRDLFCLAKNIYHEAGNQPTKGKFAVAQVTINRTRDPKFAGTVCNVVMAHNQFSWTRNRKLRSAHPHNDMWNESMRVAKAALEDGFRVKGMEYALYYHANYVHPRWRHVTRLAQIGAHIFYNRA